MGSFINICELNGNIKTYDIIVLNKNKTDLDIQKINSIILILKKLYLHSYFIKLKSYNKTYEDKNNIKNLENKNNNNHAMKNEQNLEKNQIVIKNETSKDKNNKEINEKINETKNKIITNNNENNENNENNDNNNEDNNNITKETIINIKNNCIEKKNEDKDKDKDKDESLNIFNNTPNPEENSTPTGNYDKTLIPGELIFNFNDIPINDEILKVENDLGEFIIEQKELLKYMAQYPYSPKLFSIRYPVGEKYSGYFSPNWEKEIFGIQINPNGSKYVGLFKKGMYEGRGRLIFRKGDYFEGEFKNNKANGFGKYVNINGEIYIGNWLDDKQEGKGELILKNGCRYIGDFKNGKENGKGKIIWPDSSFYEGDFVNNYFEGYGIYMMRNKKNYIGQWKMGQMNGFGIFNYPDGKSYKGYFEKDKKNGFGIYSGKNNLRYEGKYKKGKQYGIGRIINEKGEKQLGLYLKGKRLKFLNEKDFKEDIQNIDKEIEKINYIINNNEFFVKNIEHLTNIQNQCLGNSPIS